MVARLLVIVLLVLAALFVAVGVASPSAADSPVVTSFGTGAAIATSSPAETVPSPDAEGWLSRLNDIRAMAGLAPVSENSSWSEACRLHARYMSKNGLATHEEDPSNPWYTAEGATAGRASNCFLGQSGVQAIDGWARTPFHAVGMLDPRLTSAGFGSYSVPGETFAACLNVISGRASLSADVSYPVVWPGQDSASAYTMYWGGEIPDPLSGTGYTNPVGLPIIAQFDQVPSVTESGLRAGNVNLEHVVITETTYSNPDPSAQALGRSVLGGRHAVVIIPRRPLSWGTTYSVELVVNGRPCVWSFRTIEEPVSTSTTTAPPSTTTTLPPTTTTTLPTTTTTAPPPTTSTTARTTTTTTPPSVSFVDVASNQPYHDAIQALAAAGIVSGYDDGRFGPDDLVKRAQFAKMIDLSLGFTVTEGGATMPFGDVERPANNLYPDDFVAFAYQNHLVEGKDPTHFQPYVEITRAQVMTMIVRAAKGFKASAATQPPVGWHGTLTAGDPTHGANIATAEYNGLLAGIDLGGWNIWGKATRGEVAQIMWNLRQK